MAEHRSAVTRIAASSVHRRRRWLIGAVGALGASGLILAGPGVPASAGDVHGTGNVHAGVEVQDGCVTAAVDSGEADGSVGSPSASDAPNLQADGQGTATVSVCRDDLGGPPPGDPGGSLPGGLDGSPAGEVVGVLTAALEGGLPGDGGGSLPGDPTGGLPGGLDGVVPDEPGGVVPGGTGGTGGPGGPGDQLPGDLGDVLPGSLPDGSGTDPGGLLDRLPQVLPMALDSGGPGGNSGGPGGNGGAPAVNTAATGPATGSPAVSGARPERSAPTDIAVDGDPDHGASAPIGTPVAGGATLPATGGGLGNGVLRLIAFLGLGRAGLGLAIRRRTDPIGS